MHMDGTDLAIIGGGGTAALTFVLGVVQRYVGPRLEAQVQRIEKLERQFDHLDARSDELVRGVERSRSKAQEFTSLKIAEVHAKFEALFEKQGEALSDIKASLAEIKGEMRTRRRSTSS